VEAGAVLKRARLRRKMTQARLAPLVGVSESTLRMYELGLKTLPHDVANQAAATLGAPEICFAVCQQCPANWLLTYLPHVDRHPITQIHTVLEEAGEAVAAVQALDLRNKTGSQDLDGTERQAVEAAIDQLFDLVPLVAIAVSSWCRSYGLDMRALHRRHRRKLVARGYTGEGEEGVS